MIILFILFIIFIIGLIHHFIDSTNEDTIENIPPQKIITENKDAESISETNSKKDCVVVTLKGQKYDITDFIKKHPGGKEILRENIGKDIEQQMLDAGHSDHAYKILDRYKIS